MRDGANVPDLLTTHRRTGAFAGLFLIGAEIFLVSPLLPAIAALFESSAAMLRAT